MADIGHNYISSAPSRPYFKQLLNASTLDDALFFSSLDSIHEFQCVPVHDETLYYPILQEYSSAIAPTIVRDGSAGRNHNSGSSSNDNSSCYGAVPEIEAHTTSRLPVEGAVLTQNGRDSSTEEVPPPEPKRSKALPPPYAANLINFDFGQVVLTHQNNCNSKNKGGSGSSSSSNRRNDKSASSTTKRLLPMPVASASTTARPQSVMYKCDEEGCTKSFTRRYNLTSHKRTHTMERPYPCFLCPKRFARHHDRNRHAKLHLGIKAYVCPHCSKAFARQDALNRHLKPALQAVPCCSRRQRIERK